MGGVEKTILKTRRWENCLHGKNDLSEERDAIGVSQWEVGESQWEVGVPQWKIGVSQWEVVVTVVDITVEEIGVKSGTMVVTVEGWFITVEGWFITVVGAWWGGSAEQGVQIQLPTSPRENMDLKVCPGSPEQVEWTYLLQRLHWIEICPTSREQMEQEYLGFVRQTGVGLGLGWTLPLASRRKRIRRQVRGGE